MPPRRLPVIRSAQTYFDCGPYHARIEAGVCVRRQQQALRRISPKDAFTKGPAGDYRLCVGCAIGAHVARRLKVEIPEVPEASPPSSSRSTRSGEEEPRRSRAPRRTPTSCDRCGEPHWVGGCAVAEEEDDEDVVHDEADRDQQMLALERELAERRRRRRAESKAPAQEGKKKRAYHCGLCGLADHNRNGCPKNRRRRGAGR